MSERRIAIDVDDTIVSQAARYVVAGNGGWQLCNNPSAAEITIGGLRVPDRCDCQLELLVVPPQPAQALKAVDALTGGIVGGVVAADELEQLPQALAAIDAGLVPISRRVMDAAQGMPRLSDRQNHVLGTLLVGLSYANAARLLNVSEATIKRDIQELCAAFGVASREQLLAAAMTAGITPSTGLDQAPVGEANSASSPTPHHSPGANSHSDRVTPRERKGRRST